MSRIEIERPRTWLHAWVNIHRKNEIIATHTHNAGPYCYLSGHVTLQCSETSTIYFDPLNQSNNVVIHESPNIVGKLALFQQHIPHCTTPHPSSDLRITMAFDLLLDEDYQCYSPNSEQMESAVLFDDPDY